MRLLIIAVTVFFAMALNGCDENTPETVETLVAEGDYSLLVFSKTAGWRHDSIEAGIEAVAELGREHGFSVTATEYAGHFTEENLRRYNAVLFLNTTETVFDETQREAFKSYIQRGGGFAGVHSATDTEYGWPWYGELVGAWFDNHPNDPNVREAIIRVVNPDHSATEMLPEEWQREDEWYNFGYMNDDVNVLLELDTDSYEGSDHPGNHPIAWYHDFDGGRAFYTALGHTIESFSEELFLSHLAGGLKYAMDME